MSLWLKINCLQVAWNKKVIINFCVILNSGSSHEEGFHAAVPVWCLLRICSSKGAGNQKHHLDCRMCGSAAPSQDWQLHSNILSCKYILLAIMSNSPLKHTHTHSQTASVCLSHSPLPDSVLICMFLLPVLPAVQWTSFYKWWMYVAHLYMLTILAMITFVSFFGGKIFVSTAFVLVCQLFL